MSDYRCTECGNRHAEGLDCPEVLAQLAAARREGYLQALDDCILAARYSRVGLLALDELEAQKADYLKGGRR